jgi:methionyl-tRNA formyltransferase
VGFCTAVIVPSATLDALGFGAYNFHPGPPAYPGWMPAAFAAYDGVTEFGATAHTMSARVDEGSIIAVDTFPVAPSVTRTELARRAYLALLGVFRRLAPALATRGAPLPGLPLVWGQRKTTRAQFASLCDIPFTIDKAELLRRVNGFGAGDGFSVPTVWLHGVPFRFTAPGGTTG